MSKPKASLQDRRRFPRRPFGGKVSVLIQGEYWMGQGQEIGEGGLSFFFPNSDPSSLHLSSEELTSSDSVSTVPALGLEQRIVLSFQIPKGPFLTLQALVRNQIQSTPEPIKSDSEAPTANSNPVYGCQFISIPFEHRREIRTYMSTQRHKK